MRGAADLMWAAVIGAILVALLAGGIYLAFDGAPAPSPADQGRIGPGAATREPVISGGGADQPTAATVFAAPEPAAGVLEPAPAVDGPVAATVAPDLAPAGEPEHLAAARDVAGGLVAPPATVVGPVARLQPAPAVKSPTGDPVPPRRFFQVVVENAGTIAAGTKVLRLADVDVPGADAECAAAAGRRWSCGTLARTALRRLVQSRSVLCRPAGEGSFEDPELVVRCAVGRTDLATWLVEHGWAEPAAGAEETLASLAATAREEGRGLWQAEPEEEPAVPAAAQSAGEAPAAAFVSPPGAGPPQPSGVEPLLPAAPDAGAAVRPPEVRSPATAAPMDLGGAQSPL